jgi:uncharacterized membrane protein
VRFSGFGGGLILFAIYLGIGAFLHGVFYQTQFDWNSTLTYGWLLGWPIALFVTFWVVILIGFIIVIIGVVIFTTYDGWRADRRRKRRLKKHLKT